jgi:integrase
MANVYPRGRVWWCWGYTVDGDRWSESTHQRDKRAAELAAVEIERRYAADPEARTRAKLTLEKALGIVLAYQREAGKAPATIRATTYHAQHLVAHLPAKAPLASIKLVDTTAYLRKRLAEGASRHTAAKELRTLTQAMRRCAKLGLFVPKVDPVHFIPDELGKVYTPRSRWLTPEEYRALLGAMDPATDKRREHDRRDYVVAWCHLGLRKSELFSIQPSDYSPTRRELRVRGTKTEGADRLVPVAPVVADVLERRCRLKTPFPAWTDGSCTRDLAAACARAGIAPVTPNDLRRTFCSWLCQAGVPERVCAELLGHRDTTMVRAVYGHLDRRSMVDAIATLGTVATCVAAKGDLRLSEDSGGGNETAGNADESEKTERSRGDSNTRPFA